jgi:hypothetical protein
MKDRAGAALANLQRKAYAMSVLRSRIESRIDTILQNGGNSDNTGELNRLLDLVKNGEQTLKEVSDRVESARFLEEFVHIINGAAESVNEIKGDVEELVPMAEAALAQIHDAIAQVSVIVVPESRGEIDPSILAQISAELAVPPDRQSVEVKTKIAGPGQAAAPERQEKLEEVAV